MVVKPEQERVRNLLTDTVTLLCKNGLTYGKEMRVQGLLGISLDEDDVFIVHINEKFEDLGPGKDIPTIDFPASLELDNNKDSEPISSKKRRKRRGSRDSDTGSVSGNATPSKRNRDANSEDCLEVRVKQEQPEDVICLEDNDMPNIKPDPLREASFSTSSFGQLEQNTQPYVTGMIQSGAQSVTSQMSDNSNASWDGSSSSQLPQLAPYKGAAGMQAGVAGSGGVAWNTGDPSSPHQHGQATSPVCPKQEVLSDLGLTDVAQALRYVSPSAAAFMRASINPHDNQLIPPSPAAVAAADMLANLQGKARPRRPVDSPGKEHGCEVEGCSKWFYQKQTLRRHQRDKHKAWWLAQGFGRQHPYLGVPSDSGGGEMMPSSQHDEEPVEESCFQAAIFPPRPSESAGATGPGQHAQGMHGQ